tara:strand:+ start:14708 stop:15460 length:753 start_codon:yes stop_codon:yes gene_type:complete
MGFKNYLWDEAWELNVSRGKVRGAYHIIKFGENLDVDGSMETIWDGGGLYTYLTSAGVLTVTSSDTDDAASGTGARTVTVEGLDANYNLVSETLTVGGSAGTIEFYRVFRAFVETSGSSGTNEGTISIASGATTLAQIGTVGSPIETGLGQTFMALYTVPAGYTGFIYQFDVSTAKSDGNIFLVKRGHTDNGTWRSQDIIHANVNSIERNYKFPLKIEEKSDIEVRALSLTNNMKCAATFCILLVQNETE